MKVVTKDWLEHSGYIGKWYPGQYQAQPLYFEVHKDSDVEIGYNPENGTPGYVFNGHATRFYFGKGVISHDEAEAIIEDLKELAEQLLESHEENYNRSNYIGYWDREVEEKIEQYLLNFESELMWVDENDLDEEEIDGECEE